jgi:vacuolar protein sorting-associated protein VTA1
MRAAQVDKPHAGLADDDALYMEGFANRIFNTADKLDRSGRSDAATAKALYASSIFFEVLRQFGELEPDVAAKQKYAAWRAADIRAAVKEGRAPAPPPSATAAPDDGAPLGDAPSDAWAPAQPGPGPSTSSTPATPPPVRHASASTPPSGVFSPTMERGRPSLGATPSPPPGLKAPLLTDLPAVPSSSGLPSASLVEAQTAAKVAASALSFDDVPTAITHLRQALHALNAL